MPVAEWTELGQSLDAAVDDQWGERMWFVPWIASDFDEGRLDPTRAITEAVGVLTSGTEIVVPAGGEVSFGAIIGRMAVSDLWLSIPMRDVRASAPRQGDRVVTLDQTLLHPANTEYEVDRVSVDHAGRGTIHLLRRPGQEALLFVTTPTPPAPSAPPRVVPPSVLPTAFAPMFDNINVFYAPVVAALPQALAPMFDNANAFYAPDFVAKVLAPIFNNTNAFYAPSVVPKLLVPMFSNANAFYAPTMAPSFNWADAWTLADGTKPSAVLDFANGQYYDGTSNSATLTSMVQNGTVTPGSGLLCNNGNINCIGPLLTALQGASRTIALEVGGGTIQVAGLVSSSQGSPDALLIQNNQTADVFAAGVSNSSIWSEPVAWTTINACASSWGGGNISVINRGLSGVRTAAATPSAVLAAQLGSYNHASLFNGFIRNFAVYPLKVSDPYLKRLSWRATPWRFPLSPGLGVGPFDNSNPVRITPHPPKLDFDWNNPWTTMISGVVSNLPGAGSFNVIFTTVNATGAPWTGFEFLVDQNGKLAARIMGNWDGTMGAGHPSMIQVHGSQTLALGTWFVAAMTYDGSGLASGVKTYLNGVPDTMTTDQDNLGGATTISNQPFQIGGQITGGGTSAGFMFQGYMNQFTMHNVARSAAYIAANYAGSSAPPIDANTVLYYDWRDGTGTSVTDMSGNNYTGTFFGSGLGWI